MSEDREQATPGPTEVPSARSPLPRRSPTRTGNHRAPDVDVDGPDDSELAAILQHLHRDL